MAHLTSSEINQIKNEISALTRKAESGEDFSKICLLETLITAGPWFNGVSQASAVEAWRTANG
jgi:hypothetical protein